VPTGSSLIQFNDMMHRIEIIINNHIENRRIYDKEIAQALNLTPEYFAVIKKRGKIPYEAIAAFCQAEKISMNWVLFGQEPQKLQ